MAEKINHSPEHKLNPIDTSAEIKRQQERLNRTAEHEKSPDVAEIQRHVETQAVSGKEVNVGEKQESSAQSPVAIHKQLKDAAYKRTLSKTRDQLSAPERAFSKIVHQPFIDKASQISAQTIARPSGILGGGILALAGGSFVLFFSKRYGFEYNYLLFAILFVGGFLLGLALEAGLRLIRRRQAD